MISRLAARLKKHHGEIPKLHTYQQATAKVPQLGIPGFDGDRRSSSTRQVSEQYELPTGDALIVATMRQHGLTKLGSEPISTGYPG